MARGMNVVSKEPVANQVAMKLLSFGHLFWLSEDSESLPGWHKSLL